MYRNRSRRNRGTILVVTMLAVLVLAGLLAYVLNMGQRVNRRVRVQHAADASAAAGAAAMARAMNTASMNNAAMARIVALMNVLDGMPRAVEFTRDDQQALHDVLAKQLQHGVSDRWVRRKLREARGDVRGELRTLDPMDDLLDEGNLNLHNLTRYRPPDGKRGRFWRALETLEAHARTSLQTLPQAAQLRATRAGKDELEGAGQALLLPTTPSIPWRRDSFDTLEAPVKQGRVPPKVDHSETNRGPWDTIYGWRAKVRRDPVSGGTGGGAGGGSTPISRGLASGFRSGFREVLYRPYGPQSWMLGLAGDFRNDDLPYSRFAARLGRRATAKLHYLWPFESRDPPTRAIHPRWELDFEDAAALGEDQPQKIHETAFVVVEIKSQDPPERVRGGPGGRWAYLHNQATPRGLRVARPQGWHHPDRHENWDVTRVEDHIWRDTWKYQTLSDNDLGLSVRRNDEDKPIPYTIHRIDTFVFAGANTGEAKPIPDPHAGLDQSTAPGPVVLDRAQIDQESKNYASSQGKTRRQHMRRRHLRVLGVAQQSEEAVLWRSRFEGRKPHPPNVALAQAHVFNNHSWDLWTQMWSSQLQRIQHFSAQPKGPGWLARMETGQAADVPNMNQKAYERLHKYLQSVQPLAALLLRH